MSFEDDLGWEYFGSDPMESPRMMEHMDWHQAEENKPWNKWTNYGERFLLFHKQYIDKFDVFRFSKGLSPVSGWDPSTPIPNDLAHPHVLEAARVTSNPFASNPACKTPTWATITGGSDPAPGYGYTKLDQFQSLDELGRAIDSGWHGTVHNTIGGDMKKFHSPIDPVFWRWHRWIDNVRVTWEATRHTLVHREIALIAQILFGVTNDGGGIEILPGGGIIRVPPRGPSTPVFGQLSVSARESLLAHLIGQAGYLLANKEAGRTIQKLAVELAGNMRHG